MASYSMRGFTPFSIRLAPATRANLEAIQREWSAQSGQKITLAQVVDRLLEGPAARGDLATEVDELNTDPLRTIRQINEKLASHSPYRRSEWLFIAEQIQEDIDRIPSHQATFDASLWSAVYDALILLAGLFTSASPVLRYVASKATNSVSDGDEIDPSSIQRALAVEKAKFLSHPWPVKDLYVARALHVSLRDGGIAIDEPTKIPDSDIEKALASVKSQLTKLATRAIVDHEETPLLGSIFNSSLSSFHFSTELVSVSARQTERGDLSCGLILGNSDLSLQLSLNGYGQIADLSECLAASGLSKVRKCKNYEVRTPYREGEKTFLSIVNGGTAWLSDQCVHDLRTGLSELLMHEEWSEHLAQLRNAYGR